MANCRRRPREPASGGVELLAKSSQGRWNGDLEVRSWRPLRLSVVATVILLGIQGWTGDFVNVFVTTTPTTNVNQSVDGFF